MTLKNNRAPLLCCFQLCAWFHCHMWIQTGVRVRKRLSWVLTSVTLTFDLWPWPFAWTSLLTMVITPENFMMIRWWEHGEKGVTDRRTDGRTDRRTDGRTDWTSHIAAWSQLKIHRNKNYVTYRKMIIFYLDTMTSTNSSNDRLVLGQNVEINSIEYFSCDVFFREWNRRPRGLETSLRNHQEICLWVQSYFNDLLWFIERLSVKIFIYSSFVTIDDVIFLFLKNFPS